jgi:hypothetical protein
LAKKEKERMRKIEEYLKVIENRKKGWIEPKWKMQLKKTSHMISSNHFQDEYFSTSIFLYWKANGRELQTFCLFSHPWDEAFKSQGRPHSFCLTSSEPIFFFFRKLLLAKCTFKKKPD